jgi:elongation factor 1-beta
MGIVMVKLKVMPVSPEVNKDELSAKIKETVESMDIICRNIDIEPLAFGLYAVFPLIEMEEKEGGTEPVEEALANLDDVESVESVEVSLV